jgi:soluble lytic murein transglycosylase-like protein
MKTLLPMLFLGALFSINVEARVMSYNEVKDLTSTVLSKNSYGLTDAVMSDMNNFCPRFYSFGQDGRKNFFAHLIASMSRFESGFDPNQTFHENNGNVSAGLLQISKGSLSSVYRKNGCSIISTTADLKNPEKNIECGLAIISTLVIKDKNLAKSKSIGASRYWSVLRAPYRVYIKSLRRTVTVGKKDMVIKSIRKSYPACF